MLRKETANAARVGAKMIIFLIHGLSPVPDI